MSNQGATLTACNGGASGLLKDIQRRLSTSGILPGLKPDPPAVVVPQSGNSNSPTQNKPYKLKNVSTGSESYDCLHYNRSKVRNNFFYLICIRCFLPRQDKFRSKSRNLYLFYVSRKGIATQAKVSSR